MAAPRLGAIARVTQRLAVLLSAGVSPASAWQYLDDPDFGEFCAMVATREHEVAEGIADAAHDLPGAEREAWLGVASAWRVAAAAGAPLAPSLAQFAVGLRALSDAQREAEVALAGPLATGRLVLALPSVGIVVGTLLGFDTLRILFTTPPGIACLVAGIVLLLAARRWTRNMAAAAGPRDSMPGLQLELLAIAVSGGGSLDRARSLVAAGAGAEATAEAVLALSQRAGVPAGALLRAEADEARREARADAQRRAARLGVQLMIPLGVCVFPAFMLLGVAPLLISVVTATVGNF